MKTPTTLYLAYRGWFAANVPLILNRHPPQELINAPARRVFCLDIDPGRLVQLRRVRASVSGISPPGYTSVDHASRELRYARELTRRYRWQIIEVSNKSVEDIAQTIITLYRESSPENSLRE
jgi:regulator of PEP synthase PpsR (kinase-PPPase family)